MNKLKALITKQYSLKFLFFKYWLGSSAIIILSSIVLFYFIIVPLIQIEVFSLYIAIYFVTLALAIKIILSAIIIPRLFILVRDTSEFPSILAFIIVLSECLFVCWLEFIFITGFVNGTFFP
ncbi:hypothetical protein JEP40_12305 [Proteus vulgaris]|uniref:hypothetical protein n=1 Tax=Proteus vulgaris TaxID=585 RepID=UPI0018E43B20|nr:hypothetical protein [Proteus vulgaris]MBI6529892.1 hypothetical protein [Proteus vulgaris]